MAPAPLFSLVYTSTESRSLTEDDFDAILARSRSWNGSVGVTGMLLYKDGAFMQALEGGEKMVRKTFRFISRDKRHQGVRMLSAGPLPERQFAEWTMGFRRVDDADPAVDGHDDFLARDHIGPSWSSPTPARVLLDWFRLHSGQFQSGPPSVYNPL